MANRPVNGDINSDVPMTIKPPGDDSRGPSYKHGLTLIPILVSNHMLSKMWDEITYPLPNLNSYTVEVWE